MTTPILVTGAAGRVGAPLHSPRPQKRREVSRAIWIFVRTEGAQVRDTRRRARDSRAGTKGFSRW